MTGDKLYSIRNLEKWYKSRNNDSLFTGIFSEPDYLKAVDDVSFEINKGEILGVAGQSGCGKSTLGELILQLQEPTGGEIDYKGENILEYDKSELKEYRRNVQVIFQDPYESINPRFTTARTVAEPLKIHGIGSPNEQDKKTAKALADAGLTPPEAYLDKLPGELSGGERQRVCIARALVLDPEVIIADEPVSMLDVSVRTELLQLFKRLQQKKDVTLLYISHDLSTINYLTDRTLIMYLGNIVEIGPTEQVIHEPAHPYTKDLVDSVPESDPDKRRKGSDTKGDVPDPVNLPNYCRFAPRCKFATEECKSNEPPLESISYFTDVDSDNQEREEHKTACYHPVNRPSGPEQGQERQP